MYFISLNFNNKLGLIGAVERDQMLLYTTINARSVRVDNAHDIVDIQTVVNFTGTNVLRFPQRFELALDLRSILRMFFEYRSSHG